jgi:hypothetical protein
MQHLRRWAAIYIIAAGAIVACSGGGLKGAGESCVASSECASGLICDFGHSPAQCAATSTVLPDAPPEPDADGDGGVDAPADAPPDAAIDAAVDAPDAM